MPEPSPLVSIAALTPPVNSKLPSISEVISPKAGKYASTTLITGRTFEQACHVVAVKNVIPKLSKPDISGENSRSIPLYLMKYAASVLVLPPPAPD